MTLEPDSTPSPIETVLGKKPAVAVAFCADRLMEAPLHVAASSLLRSLHPNSIARFYLLLTDFSEPQLQRLRQTLDNIGKPYEAKFLEATDTSMFRNFRPLHGNFTPYHRLLLPDMVQEERLLYLDSDTMTTLDVSPLFEEDMEGKAAGFVVDGRVKTNLESKFFLSLGKAPESPMFNSGAMLFDLQAWHRQDCTARIFDFCERYSSQLVTADQTALNAIFAEDCYHMALQYNIKVHPVMGSQPIPAKGIFHFVGSPKPWDIGGSFLVQYANLWFAELRKTAIPFHERISWLNPQAWSRSKRILGGYRRVVMEKFTKE